MAAAHGAVDATNGKTLPHGPSGYILSYGVSYSAMPTEGKRLDEVAACPPSAVATHAAFVSKCGFSPTFSPTLDGDVTRSRMLADVCRAATTMASHDVVAFFFSGHGESIDGTSCIIDSADCVLSVRKLQAVFAETVVKRGLRDVAFIVILDCCQTLSYDGMLLPLD